MKSNTGFYSIAGLSAVIALAIVLTGCSKSQPKIPRENRTQNYTQNNGQAPKPGDDAAKKKKEAEKKKKAEEEAESDSSSGMEKQPESQLLQDLAVDYVGENLVLKVAKNGTYQGYVVFGLTVGQTVGPNEAFVLYALSYGVAANYQQTSSVDPLLRKFNKEDFYRNGLNTIGVADRSTPTSDIWTYSFILPFEYRTGKATLENAFVEVGQVEKKKRAEGMIAKLRGPVPAEVGKMSVDLDAETVVIRLEGNDAKQLYAQIAQTTDSLIYCESEARCLVKIKFRNGELVSAK